MRKSPHIRAALFIIGAGVLGAVAVVLVPGLFEEFRTARFAAILVLTAGAVAFAGAAKRTREQMTE